MDRTQQKVAYFRTSCVQMMLKCTILLERPGHLSINVYTQSHTCKRWTCTVPDTDFYFAIPLALPHVGKTSKHNLVNLSALGLILTLKNFFITQIRCNHPLALCSASFKWAEHDHGLVKQGCSLLHVCTNMIVMIFTKWTFSIMLCWGTLLCFFFVPTANCPSLDIQFGSFKGNFERGSNVTFSCYPGYTLVGIEMLHCSQDGKWNGNPPMCLGECQSTLILLMYWHSVSIPSIKNPSLVLSSLSFHLNSWLSSVTHR